MSTDLFRFRTSFESCALPFDESGRVCLPSGIDEFHRRFVSQGVMTKEHTTEDA